MNGELNKPARTRFEYLELTILCVGLLLFAAGVVTATIGFTVGGFIVALVGLLALTGFWRKT
ncbi:MAG TPA: hypothetical protein VGE41_01785 [Verrucomicrobiae bacterium]